MRKKYYFMSGFPRSGSTVLSTILNQNPRIYSGPSSPVLSTMYVVENHLQNDELFNGYPKPEQAKLIISNIIEQFYSDIEKPIVIDKNRAWPGRIPYIEGYIKEKAKIIFTVRDIDEILTSMIMLIRRNPYQEGQERINFIDEQLVKLNIPITDDNRCEYIAGSQGILGQTVNTIIECLQQGYRDRIHFVEYRELIQNPKNVLNKIYEFLGEPLFEHSYTNLHNKNRERDIQTYGISDMHEVHSELKMISLNPKKVLSKNILDKCIDTDFWRRLETETSSK